MGVEPTRQRMAPPTGFEARPIHQDRFPSKILGTRARRRHAASLNRSVSLRMRCTSPVRRSRPTRSKYSSTWIARLRPSRVASRKRRGGDVARCTQLAGDRRQPVDRAWRIEQILHHLVQLPLLRQPRQRGAHQRLGLLRIARQIAHPGAFEARAGQRHRRLLRDARLGRRQVDTVLRQVHERAALRDAAIADQPRQQLAPQRLGQLRHGQAPQPRRIGAELLDVARVVGLQRVERRGTSGLRVDGREHERRCAVDA